MKANKNTKKILLFVCTGNTCRSPMAQQIFKHFLAQKGLLSQYRVCSAGLYVDCSDKINDLAAKALLSLNIKPRHHHCQQLTSARAAKAFAIVCMSRAHKEMIVQQMGGKNVFCFSEITGAHDVPDPFGGDLEKYISCANYINYACEDILRLLLGLQ